MTKTEYKMSEAEKKDFLNILTVCGVVIMDENIDVESIVGWIESHTAKKIEQAKREERERIVFARPIQGQLIEYANCSDGCCGNTVEPFDSAKHYIDIENRKLELTNVRDVFHYFGLYIN